MNETNSMPEVYAVEAQGMCYYASLELIKIFGAQVHAELFAEELRKMVDEDGELEYALVKVEVYSVN